MRSPGEGLRPPSRADESFVGERPYHGEHETVYIPNKIRSCGNPL